MSDRLKGSIDPSLLMGARGRAIEVRMPPTSGEVVFSRVTKAIQEFEATLSPQEEVGAYLVNIPGAQQMHIASIEQRGREMIAFHGVNEHGKPMLLLQHVHQVNILLTALPKLHDQARRIGFNIQGLQQDASPESTP